MAPVYTTLVHTNKKEAHPSKIGKEWGSPLPCIPRIDKSQAGYARGIPPFKKRKVASPPNKPRRHRSVSASVKMRCTTVIHALLDALSSVMALKLSRNSLRSFRAGRRPENTYSNTFHSRQCNDVRC